MSEKPLKRKKDDLENKINDLIHNFEEDTGLRVTGMRWMAQGDTAKRYSFCSLSAEV